MTHTPETIDVQAVLDQLPPKMRDTLGALAGTSRPMAEVIVQLIPFDERPLLERLGITMPGRRINGEYRSLCLTDFGFDVIAAADHDRKPS
jgi:hypothetical protein